MQAGGTSLYDSYGGAIYAYTSAFTGWLGIGYQDGFKFGAAIQTSFQQDSLRIGSGILLQQYATDLFSTGTNVLTQDIRYTFVRPRTVALLAAGSAARTNGSQFFQAYSFDDPFGAITIRHQPTNRLQLGFNGVVATRQSAIAGASWLAAPNVTLAGSAGIGANDPYGAVSAEYRARTVAVRASYVTQGDHFRRADLPFPVQTEADRENIQVDWQPWPLVTLGAARQNFLQSATDSLPALRASGNSIYGGISRFGFRAQAGLYDSHAGEFSNLSSYYALGRSFGRWLDAEVYVLQSRPSVGDNTTTPIVSLRQNVSQRLSLLQQFTFQDDRVTVQLGGSLVTPFGDLGVSYQIVQRPLEPLDPFKSVLSLSARIQLGRYSTNLNTVFQPDGSVNYTASASTFLYFGQFGGMQPNLVSGQIGRFMIKGRVLDADGQPIDGAALDFDGAVTFTNPEGQFQLRVNRPRDYKLTVLLGEFLLPGKWEVVSAPAAITAAPEQRAGSTDIVLRRVIAP